MCLFPRLIKNRRYIPNKKNGGVPPPCDDVRKLYVAVGCGKCMECMKQKALQWKIRLNEELKVQKHAYFVTLTFAPEELKKLTEESGQGYDCNAVAGLAVRRYLERWRKKYKKSQRHWLITEMGQEESERIHLHGIVFSAFEISTEEFASIWKYGNVVIGQYCNMRTINYVTKYVTKLDQKHKGYVPQIFCSAGLGNIYTERELVRIIHRYQDETDETYRFPNGQKCNLPIYYRNKLFTEEQREKLWVQKLDQNTRYVNGVRVDNVDTIEGEDRYFRLLRIAQFRNLQLGYGDNTAEWKKRDYNITLKMLQKKGE